MIYAFGGWLYGIDKWLPNYVTHIGAGPWGFTENWCRDFAATLCRPVTLVGFSEGANAAMMVAAHSPMVRRAVVHSCEQKSFGYNANCDYRLFCTREDTTPTLTGTIRTHHRLLAQKASSELVWLTYVPFEQPTLFERKVLARRRHIFHNILPLLENLL